MNKDLHYNSSVISFGNLSESDFATFLNSPRYANVKKVIITDENVSELWLEHLITSFEELFEAEIIVLPPGEEHKVLEICAQVWNALSDYEIGRKDLIITLGGGVITDMGGFIASTFKRGLSFINIPTTLLAQVDASVGGKTGIDLGAHKNQIGLFSDAERVFIDATFLETLPQKEVISGYAEMLKHGLIADADYWKQLCKIHPKHELEKLLPLIHKSVLLKKTIVSEDHKEEGKRKLLNFGHTIGHALEGYCLEIDAPIPHGYAVAWGMVAESWLAHNLAHITLNEFQEIEKVIRKLYPPLAIYETAVPRLLELVKNDKKRDEAGLNFTLLSKIGCGIYNVAVPTKLVEKAFHFILSRVINHAK